MNSILIAANFARRISRELRTILLMLVFPVLIGILSVNINSYYEIEKVGLSHQFLSDNPLVQTLSKTKKFKIEYYNKDDLEKKVKSGELSIGVVIPEDFEEKLANKVSPVVKIISLRQTSNVIHIRCIFEEYIMSSVSGYSLKHLENAKNDIGTQRAALGFFLVFVLLFSGTCAGLLLEDKKSKTFMRYFLAPVKEFEVFLGTFIMCIAFGTVQILLFLGITRYVFNFDWKIHWAYVFILLITFLITSIGISMSILAFTRDVRMYSLANAGISLFSCFISGAFFSSSLMGETLDKISNIFPQKWVMSAFESLVNGQSLPDIQNNLIILLLYGAILFIIGIRTLHPSEIDL